ncbi:MAG: preprotein translocase subunit SecA [Candidatus Bipolaricaulota bacterium]|nr:preprotein translocase subunit SecA [Candidatus Bipolaricaulota bacterium]
MAIEVISRTIDYMFGQTNAQQLRSLHRHLERINELGPQLEGLSDDELTAKTDHFRARLEQGETKGQIRDEVFALVREVAARTVGMRPFDVQIIGALALDNRQIAEMQTGEGKTLVATLPAYLNALVGKVHIVTVNDYLARRDREWMGPIYEFLGLSVGLIQEGIKIEERQAAYDADITYGTNNQFGFDYLRDNMALSTAQRVQGPLDYAIVDEIDNILIDEARTPLIISGSTAQSSRRYNKFAQLARRFKRDRDFEIDEETHRLTLTDEGIGRAESSLSVDNLYSPDNTELLHHLETALKARYMFKKESDYIVKDGRVMIVDEFTGRLMPDRRYSDGLHQALEAKEGMRIQRESQTLAQITLQHYFQLYKGLCGMTGTAKTEEEEFKQIYGLSVLVIPTNRPLLRDARPDVLFRSKRSKFEAVADEVKQLYAKGRPVLIGTNSIEKSERLSSLLKVRDVPHHVLNAKHHEQEAQIVMQAGQRGAVTVATNMAGRGTDIKLGPGVAELGGLHMIGCQRHESRRIDNQLLGRAGRQGDPGSSQFFLSLEDDLIRIFGGDRIAALMDRVGMEEGQAIEHNILSAAIRRAQKRVEERNFEIRKRLLEYDLVLAKQREAIYSLRARFLLPPPDQAASIPTDDIDQYMQELIEEYSENLLANYTDPTQPAEKWNIPALKKELSHISPIAKLKQDGIDSLQQQVLGHLLGALATQRERLKERFGIVACYVILTTIDESWLSHLYTLDDMREGIGWTAYGGGNPLVAFKRGSFELFQEMLQSAAQKIIRSLLNPRLTAPSPSPAKSAKTRDLHYVHTSDSQASKKSQPPAKRKKKPGRNDPCPCGSGKKYKYCCGRND